jgi:hypothetical protein
MSRTVDALMKFCISAIILEVSLEDVHLRSTVSGLLDLPLLIEGRRQSHKRGHLS